MVKKNYLLAGLLAFGLVGLSSCGKNEEPGDDLKGKMEVISPDDSKERLGDVGVEFFEAINAKDHENLVEVVAYLGEEYGDYDIDSDYYDKLEDLYEETDPDEEESSVREVNPIAAIRGLMAMSLDAAQKGAQLATRADDIYMFTVEAGLKDLYGSFEPKKGEWRYDDSVTDRLEVKFEDGNGDAWVATLKGSDKTTRIHMAEEYECYYKSINTWNNESYTYGDDDHEKFEFSIDVPKTITFVVKCGDEKVIDMTVESDLAFESDAYVNEEEFIKRKDGEMEDYEYTSEFKFTVDYKNLNVDAVLNVNGYEESWIAKADKKSGNTTAEVKIDGKRMLKYSAAGTVDVDAYIEMINDFNNYTEDLDDYEAEYEDDEIILGFGVQDADDVDMSAFKDFSMSFNVMDKVQVLAECADFQKFYDAAYITEEEAEDLADLKVSRAFEKYIEGLNETFSITVHYDNTKTVQANIEFEGIAEEIEQYGYSYVDYYVQPVIVFAEDGSRYTFEEYFEESEDEFEDMIDAANDLAESFEKMFNKYFDVEEN